MKNALKIPHLIKKKMENVSITAQKSHRIKKKMCQWKHWKETNTKNGNFKTLNNQRDVNGYYTAQLKHMCSEI